MDLLDVDKSKCIGCGACISIDDEHFDFDDDGLSMVISNDNLKSPSLQDAIESCPTSAIKLAKTEDNIATAHTKTENMSFNNTVMATKMED